MYTLRTFVRWPENYGVPDQGRTTRADARGGQTVLEMLLCIGFAALLLIGLLRWLIGGGQQDKQPSVFQVCMERVLRVLRGDNVAEGESDADPERVGDGNSGSESPRRGESGKRSRPTRKRGGQAQSPLAESGQRSGTPPPALASPVLASKQPTLAASDGSSEEADPAENYVPRPPAWSNDPRHSPEHGLDPKRLLLMTYRKWAYLKWQSLLKLDGGKAATTKFAKMAGDVVFDMDGWITLAVFSFDTRIEFLEPINRRLYEKNRKMFQRLRANPSRLFDPAIYEPSLKSERLGREPVSGLEFDLQMVKYEQRQVEHELDDWKKRQDPWFDVYLAEISASLAVLRNNFSSTLFTYGNDDGTVEEFIRKFLDDLETGGMVGVAPLIGYHTDALYWAQLASGGKNMDFGSEQDRRAIGFAHAFIAHGYSMTQYFAFMKTGAMPIPLN